MEKLLARADQVANSRRSSPLAPPEWPEKKAGLGQQLFSKFLEQMPNSSNVLQADAARRLAAYAASTLRLAWATGIAKESASDWQRTLEESLQEALSVLALDFADPDLHRRPKAALRGLLQHLQSMDQLLLGLWAMDPELPHPWQLSEASCRCHLQRDDIADGVRQLLKQSDLTRRVASRWGVRKAWLKSGKGSPWSKVAGDSPCDALRMLRARWLEAICLARSTPSSPQTLKAISTWLLVGRDITARWHAFAIPSSKILREIKKRSGGGAIDLGAGVGYWSQLLHQSGVDVLALDLDPPRDQSKAVKVEFGDATSLHGLPCAGREMLLLCMPPPGEAACAEEALNNFRGRYVAYVGEWGSGMTATSAFHESLLSKFELEARLPLPCFPLMRLECFIFQRKKRKSAAEVIGSDGLRSCDACGAVASEEVTLYLCPVTRWWRFGSEACYDKSLPQQRALMDIQSCGIRQELPEWATWEADEWVEYGSSSATYYP